MCVALRGVCAPQPCGSIEWMPEGVVAIRRTWGSPYDTGALALARLALVPSCGQQPAVALAECKRHLCNTRQMRCGPPLVFPGLCLEPDCRPLVPCPALPSCPLMACVSRQARSNRATPHTLARPAPLQQGHVLLLVAGAAGPYLPPPPSEVLAHCRPGCCDGGTCCHFPDVPARDLPSANVHDVVSTRHVHREQLDVRPR